ncbi:unknown [Sutterella wadsworthensis CAG:135]|nr:unknown [Sutterella wadsworthensis CAG:135]
MHASSEEKSVLLPRESFSPINHLRLKSKYSSQRCRNMAQSLKFSFFVLWRESAIEFGESQRQEIDSRKLSSKRLC